MDPLQKEKRYTYADYAGWDDDKRYELIDGVAYMMSPAPSRQHQEVLVEMIWQIRSFLEGKPCKVYAAPFDVRLNAAGDAEDTVVQPDIVIVCDKSKLDKKGCNGTPDMVVEILSPSTASRDRLVKFNKYLEAGIKEYWIVDTETKSVQACILEKGRYVVSMYSDTDTAPVQVLEGCRIDLKDVFAE
ncbi:MAG: Uma2 family endonuclease [Clostridiales bacterium]|nr:Uma2 family endonuclease [Clostridiales bacterium]